VDAGRAMGSARNCCQLHCAVAPAAPRVEKVQSSRGCGGRPRNPRVKTRSAKGQGRPSLISSKATPVATAYTAWWNTSIAISSFAQKGEGGAISNAGRVTWAAP
jgi:hypothetical protein